MKKFEQFLTEARGRIFIEDCEPGKTYTVGYRGNNWNARFEEWFIEDNGPRMKWTDKEGGSWEAYMFNGRMCVGSSADELKIIAEY